MRFHLTIDCDNAAFADNTGDELARILKDFASSIEGYTQPELMDDPRTLRDSNGNTVGRYWWSEEGSAEA